MALQHLRSGTADKRPTPGAMSDGQLAINTNATSTGLFFKDSAGALVKVGPVHVGTTAPNATPATGGEAGNSVGEQWLDTSGGGYSLKIWDGSAWRSEAGEFVNASGDTMTGALVMDNQQQVRFRETTANGTNYIALQAPASVASDKTITLPDVTGTVVTTGDTGSITSTMIADSTIVDGDISASAEIAVSKLADGAARQLLQTDAAGTGVEWTSNVDVPGTLDVTSTATFDSIASHPLGTAGAPTITFTGDTNTGIYSPGADQVAISTNGTGRLFVDASGNVKVGSTDNSNAGTQYITVGNVSSTQGGLQLWSTPGGSSYVQFGDTTTAADHYRGYLGYLHSSDSLLFGTASTERMRLDSSGRLGLGTSSPVSGAQLTVAGASLAVTGQNLDHSANSIRIGEEGSGAAEIRCYGPNTSTNGSLTFKMSRSDGSNSQDVVIDSSGRVGIGTTPAFGAIDHGLHIKGSGAQEGIRLETTDGSGGILEIYSENGGNTLDTRGSGYIRFNNTTTEWGRWDSSGRFLVGTSTALSSPYWSNLAKLQVTGEYGAGHFASFQAGASGAGLVFQKSRSATVGGNTVVNSGDNLMDIAIEGNDGTGFIRAAAIQCYVDGTPGTNDMPGRLVFSTTSDSASSPTERVRINAAGAFKASLAGTYESSASAYHELRTNASGDWIAYFTQTTASNPNGVLIKYTGAAPNSTGNTFLYCEDNAAVRATIRSNGGIANYSANDVNLSDINAKKDIALATGTWDCLKEWEIVNFRYKEQPDDADLNLGVIAQQVAESCPEVITIFQEATDDHPEKLGVKEQQMMWMAIKALQEAQLRIETLEAEVAALKAS